MNDFTKAKAIFCLLLSGIADLIECQNPSPFINNNVQIQLAYNI